MPDSGHSSRNAKMIKTRPLLLREGKEIIAIMERRGTMYSVARREGFHVDVVFEP